MFKSFDCLFFQELIGAPAGKLHTGRSRNDQVCLIKIKTVMTELLFVATYTVYDFILRTKNKVRPWCVCLGRPGRD